jgi:glycosyltransferase involved in cell wall biosynthesis
MKVAIVHDYLTQRGGAERVVLSLTRAFPEAAVYTSLYDPAGTFPELRQIDVRTLAINHIAPLRTHHRAALPLLAPSFSHLRVAADVVICSSSGWAHGAQVDGRKIVYCHTPARWLYQSDRYLRNRGRAVHAAAGLLQSSLKKWDKRAAASAEMYLANSSAVAERINSIYGIEAEVVPPPPAITPDGPMHGIDGLEPGFIFCVSRLLPYKNVDAVVEAFAGLPEERLVVAGSGPQEAALHAAAGANVAFTGQVSDAQLRWLYSNCRALVAAAHEDFGLTPLEAASFGKPTAALRWGGFLDTIDEGVTGLHFDEPVAADVEAAIRKLRASKWQDETIQRAAARFSEERFIERVVEAAAWPSRRAATSSPI